jgi:hypothetical protein
MPDEQPQLTRRLHKINPGLRWVAGLLAAAGLASGGVAVFITHLEAGPVALIAAGVLFAFIALSGQMPTRLKFGENEASWEAVSGVLEQAAEDVSPARRPELIDALGRIGESAPAAAASALNAVAYENMVMEMISQIRQVSIEKDDAQPFDLIRQSGAGVLFDAYLIAPSQVGISVEIKAARANISVGAVAEIVARFRLLQRADPRARALLIISRTGPSDAALQLINAEGINFSFVRVATSGDETRLASHIEKFFRELQ